ncbi:hypothetical protein BY996DRAFT_6408488 [Phakopsora pachyrhizi]|nr:hypothetical protein BY996DRAFT_6408488 [Phakopsora pachyrhizi]
MDRKYFIQITEGGATGDIVWKCLLCNSRTTTNILKHSMTDQHKAQVKDVERRQLQHANTSKSENSDLHKDIQKEREDSEEMETGGNLEMRFSTKDFTVQESSSDRELLSDSQSESSITSSNGQGDDFCMEDLIIEPGSTTGEFGDSSDWFPFKQKEIMIGCLIAGCTRTLMTRKTYNHIQVVLRMCDIELPSWKTVQTAKTKLQRISHCNKSTSQSIIGNPLTTVSIQGLLTQELGNTIVTKYLEYYPEYFEEKNIYKLSQKISISGEKNFYSSNLKEILAEDFWKPYHEITFNDGVPLHSICKNVLHELTPERAEIIKLLNPWRIKAQGRMIRHVPLNIYSDDTSGNLSKQWNKHISIFMSLAGLPPHISNQEYNTLFVATSNIATALELAAPVVEELNILSTAGLYTFDYSLQEEVLVLPVALMFMGDSPMHAKITSKIHPNVSLQPCRICNLKAKNKKEKATGAYVDKFLGQNTNGILVKPELRSWIETKKNAYHTWGLVQKGAPTSHVQRSFDGHKDTPVDILHVILLGIVKYLYWDIISGLTVEKKDELVARLQSFDISNLNIPSIKAKYLVQHYSSLVGKDFKIIIQAAPFVFFTLIEESRRKIWISLCHISNSYQLS